jgi:hypothetical protein
MQHHPHTVKKPPWFVVFPFQTPRLCEKNVNTCWISNNAN